jgi:hypothetical protein
MTDSVPVPFEEIHKFSFYSEMYGFFKIPHYTRVTVSTDNNATYHKRSIKAHTDGTQMPSLLSAEPEDMDYDEYIAWLVGCLQYQLNKPLPESERQFMGYIE